MLNSEAYERQEKRSLIGFAEAQQVAKVLCESIEIKAVVVFGSVARENEGEDLDLILICDEYIAQDFASYVRDTAIFRRNPDSYLDSYMKNACREAAYMMAEIGDVWDKIVRFVHPSDLDLFVFPPNWRERLDELQDALPHDDPNFMRNIAKDARGLWVKQ